MWVKSDLKTKIKDKLFASHSIKGVDFVFIYSTMLLEYILENTQVTYSWGGSNSSGAPDPITTVPCSLVSGTPFSGPMSSLQGFYQQIETMVKGITITPGGGFSIGPTQFNQAYKIIPTISPSCNTFDKALDTFADDICTSFPLLINPSPASGVHGAFTGATVAMQVV